MALLAHFAVGFLIRFTDSLAVEMHGFVTIASRIYTRSKVANRSPMPNPALNADAHRRAFSPPADAG